MEVQAGIDHLDQIEIIRLGTIPYAEAWEMQKRLQRELIEGRGSATLLLCEHFPVVTLGKSAKSNNLLVPEAVLRTKGIELFNIERGGDITYHGPGQLVGYPILNLNRLKRDVGWYMRTLEEVIIRTLDDSGVCSRRIQGRTGVWTEAQVGDSVSKERKIASIGVRISRWCTMHGFALNVSDCSTGFSNINPCGFTDIAVTSIEQEYARGHKKFSNAEEMIASVTDRLELRFLEIFGLRKF